MDEYVNAYTYVGTLIHVNTLKQMDATCNNTRTYSVVLNG